MMEPWFQKRRTRRLFGPGYSSDDAGDGPSIDSEDEGDLSSTVWEDSSDDSVEQDTPCLWPLDLIERYLKENDFSIMIAHAVDRWNRYVAKEQLELLSLATRIAIQARALNGMTRCCHECMVFRWVHTHIFA